MGNSKIKFKKEMFPIIYENGIEKAVLVNVEIFNKLEVIIDNLLHIESEVEDDVIAQSDEIVQLIEECNKTKGYSLNWEAELDEL